MKSVLKIHSLFGDYDVDEAPSLRAALGEVARDEKSWLLYDGALEAWHAPVIEEYFSMERKFFITASEEQKSFDRIEPILQWLLESGFRRDGVLIALGGGVVQDIAGFAASILFRGARWKLLPSTLLAQCDSCIGSKSSINIANFKNQLGTFFPPQQVILVPQFLETLPREALISGLGEIIKLHLIAGENEFAALQQKLEPLKLNDFISQGAVSEGAISEGTIFDESQHELFQEIIHDSLRIKQRFIEVDEFDKGVRNLLNYGHTFGHDYESATKYAIPHGIAVTLGVATATWFSARLNWLDDNESRRLIQWLRPYFIPYHEQLAGLNSASILGAMKHDKKNTNQNISCILTRGAGQMEKFSLAPEQVHELLNEWLAQLPALC